jgi:competence protein ComEA
MRRRPMRADLRVAPLVALVVAAASASAPAPEPLACRDPRALPVADGAPAAVGCGVLGRPPLEGAGRWLFDLPLDLNRADARALEALPRIGPTRAAAIVHARARRPFCAVGELVRVPGIGPRTVAEIEPLAVARGCRHAAGG